MLQTEAQIRLEAISNFYETEPVGMASDTLFINAVVEFFVGHEPDTLLDICMEVERQLGRDRTKGMDRTIDLDILAMDSLVIKTPRLTIPHPRCLQRSFVLEPWAEIAPEFCIPDTQLTVHEALLLLKSVD